MLVWTSTKEEVFQGRGTARRRSSTPYDRSKEARRSAKSAGRWEYLYRLFIGWKRRYGGLGLHEVRELRQLREENRKLKGIVADLTLDEHILQEVLLKKSEAREAPRTGSRNTAGVSVERIARLRAGENHALVESLSKPARSACSE